ncbi:hypothetical protein OAJ08_01500 [Candidatus Nitrosopelagicus sp.]|nr:hypothetical protein [Candidatus Nitrosopelagicus sp.]
MGISLNIVFLFALILVGISLLSVVFPALILHEFGHISTNQYDQFEIGNNAVLLVVSNIIIFSIGYLYKTNKLANFSSSLNKIRNFEISKKQSLIGGIIILIVYSTAAIPELTIDESTQFPDYKILISGLDSFPVTDSGDMIADEQNSRFVRMILLGFSQDVLGNIKVIPLLFSILLVSVAGLVAVEISRRRITGLVAMIVLLQGYTFLEYDTIAVYENLWVAFFLLSIYTIHKKWHFSGILYLLSVFSKAFSTPFLILNIFYVLKSENNSSTKIRILISYGIIILIMLGLFSLGNTIYDDVIQIDLNRFMNSLSDFSSQMRFDTFLLIMLLPTIVGLFFVSRTGLKHAESLLFFIPSLLLAGPLVALLTDFYVILPYRFIPLIVFFSISIAIVIFRNTKSS